MPLKYFQMLKRLAGLYRLETVSIMMTLTIVFLSYFIAMINFNVRIKEIKLNLREKSYISENISHLQLINKYLNSQNLYEKKITIDEHNLNEFKTAFVYNNKHEYQIYNEELFSTVEKFFVHLINLVRLLRDLPIIDYDLSLAEKLPLHIAYYYEINNYYQRALEIYQRAEEFLHKGVLKANVLLHKGFCYALLNDYAMAREHYLQVINDYKSETAGLTATILLRYLDEFSREQEKIMKMPISRLDKGMQLSVLLHYKEAVKILDTITVSSKEEKARIDYYKGLCLDALGEKEKATDAFLDVIEHGGDKKYSKLANRKLFIVNSKENKEELVKFSIEMSKIFEDKILGQIHRYYEEHKPDHKPVVSTNEKKEAARKLSNRFRKIYKSKRVLAAASVRRSEKAQFISEENKKLLETLKGKPVNIITIDNEQFSGVLMSAETERVIKVKTVLGIVSIKKNNIIKITPQ